MSSFLPWIISSIVPLFQPRWKLWHFCFKPPQIEWHSEVKTEVSVFPFQKHWLGFCWSLYEHKCIVTHSPTSEIPTTPTRTSSVQALTKRYGLLASHGACRKARWTQRLLRRDWVTWFCLLPFQIQHQPRQPGKQVAILFTLSSFSPVVSRRLQWHEAQLWLKIFHFPSAAAIPQAEHPTPEGMSPSWWKEGHVTYFVT